MVLSVEIVGIAVGCEGKGGGGGSEGEREDVGVGGKEKMDGKGDARGNGGGRDCLMVRKKAGKVKSGAGTNRGRESGRTYEESKCPFSPPELASIDASAPGKSGARMPRMTECAKKGVYF